jgi:hypothetical protein
METGEDRKVRFEGEGIEEQTLFVLRAHPITNVGWALSTFLVLLLPGLVLASLVFQHLYFDEQKSGRY